MYIYQYNACIIILPWLLTLLSHVQKSHLQRKNNKKPKSQKVKKSKKKKKKDSRFAEVHLKKLFELNDLGCTDRSKIKDSESLPSSLS